MAMDLRNQMQAGNETEKEKVLKGEQRDTIGRRRERSCLRSRISKYNRIHVSPMIVHI